MRRGRTIAAEQLELGAVAPRARALPIATPMPAVEAVTPAPHTPPALPAEAPVVIEAIVEGGAIFLPAEPVNDDLSRVPYAEHGAAVRAFALELARMYREGDTAGLAAVDAHHRAAGYGGVVVDDGGGALLKCAPGPVAEGARVTCSCSSEMLERQFNEHAELAAREGTHWNLHRTRLAERGLPAETPAAIVAEGSAR